MRVRVAIAAVTAVLAITVVGCGGDDSRDSKADTAKTSTPPTRGAETTDGSSAEKAAAIPAEPTGAERAALIAALKDIDPTLVADEDEAIEKSRNLCSTINGGGDVEKTVKARFSTGEHEVTDVEARTIGVAVSAVLCHD